MQANLQTQNRIWADLQAKYIVWADLKSPDYNLQTFLIFAVLKTAN